MTGRSRHWVALALTGSLSMGSAIAADVWKPDYDYPGQGDNWYGATGLRNLGVDFMPLTAISSLDGDDYGLGYDSRFQRFRQLPPLERTSRGGTAYGFVAGSLCGGGGPAPCPELIFSNGFEALGPSAPGE